MRPTRIHEVIDRLTLTETPIESQDEENPNYISLMTIHSSKGLEFPVVSLWESKMGLFRIKIVSVPYLGSQKKRRLLYVAMTRAKEKLIMSYAHMRQTGYQKEIRKASRFLSELPKEGINAPSFEEHQKEQIASELKQKKIDNIKVIVD